MAILRSRGFNWPGVEPQPYKDAPGAWVGVTRHVLARPELAGFEARYFEVAPGGYTTFERHEHEHVVVVLRGRGEARLGGDVSEIGPFDVVEVPSSQPHQFRNAGSEPLGFLCIVAADRDRPVPVEGNTGGGEGRQTE